MKLYNVGAYLSKKKVDFLLYELKAFLKVTITILASTICLNGSINTPLILQK